MTFAKTTWVDDDAPDITAAQLNRMEQGIGDAHVGAAVPFVTALPAGPVDGQEVSFIADALQGIVWRLKYRAADPSPYKWQFVGGAPLQKFAATGESVANTSNEWVDLTAAGAVPIALPLAGDYLLEAGASVNPASNAQVNFAVWSGVNGSGGAAVTVSTAFIGTGPYGAVLTNTQRVGALPAAGTIRLRGSTNGATVTYLSTWQVVTPVRVG